MQRINHLRSKRMARFSTRAEVDSDYLPPSEHYEESEASSRNEDHEEAFNDIERVKEVLAIKTDLVRYSQNALTEETLERTTTFKPPLPQSSSRIRIRKTQVAPNIPALIGIRAAPNTKENDSSRRSSGVLPSTEQSRRGSVDVV